MQKLMENNKTVFNACAQLKIEPVYADLRSQGLCGLEAIMMLQKNIQETVYGHNWEAFKNSNEVLKAFYDWNDRALDSEKEELLAFIRTKNNLRKKK